MPWALPIYFLLQGKETATSCPFVLSLPPSASIFLPSWPFRNAGSAEQPGKTSSPANWRSPHFVTTVENSEVAHGRLGRTDERGVIGMNKKQCGLTASNQVLNKSVQVSWAEKHWRPFRPAVGAGQLTFTTMLNANQSTCPQKWNFIDLSFERPFLWLVWVSS